MPTPWTAAPAGLLTAEAHRVDIWWLSLDPPAPLAERLTGLLSTDERALGERRRQPALRRRFAAGRGWLRAILARYVGVPAPQLVFATGPHGKPFLPGLDANATVEFNLAHTGDTALLAVGRGQPLGVDVEAVDPRLTPGPIAARCFSAAELAAWHAVPVERQRDCFYRTWVRKEAYAKARGAGFALPLSRFDVPVGDAAPSILCDRGDPPAPARWRLVDVDPGNGCVGALACASAVDTWRYLVGSDTDDV